MKSAIYLLNIFAKLTRFYLSLAIAFSALAGTLLYNHTFSGTAVYTFLGVFLLSSAASALNQFQERELDKSMSRTRNRPLPSGQMSPHTAIFLSSVLILSGMMVLYWGTTAKAMLLGIINLAWYSIVYTPLKRKTAFALLAGAFNGAIPPIIGWTAAGGQITDWQVILIASFMYLWQIPHFWLLSIRYADDYKRNKIPLFNLMMRESLVNRIFFIWIFGTTLSTMVFPVAGMITSPYRIVALLFIDAGIIGYFASMVFNKTIFKPRVASLVLNGFQILILFLLLVEASL